MKNNPSITFLRTPDVLSRTAFARSSLYLKINNGLFVPPINISERSVAWIEHEVDSVLLAMAGGANEDKLSALVSSLIRERTELSKSMVA